jgi:hypothetical protein
MDNKTNILSCRDAITIVIFPRSADLNQHAHNWDQFLINRGISENLFQYSEQTEELDMKGQMFQLPHTYVGAELIEGFRGLSIMRG